MTIYQLSDQEVEPLLRAEETHDKAFVKEWRTGAKAISLSALGVIGSIFYPSVVLLIVIGCGAFAIAWAIHSATTWKAK